MSQLLNVSWIEVVVLSVAIGVVAPDGVFLRRRLLR